MTKYILMVFAGACSFGILSTFVKLSYGQGYTAAEISFSQAFTGMIVLWILVWIFNRKNKNRESLLTGKWTGWRAALFAGVTIGLTTFVYYLSVQYIPASVAIVILMQFTWIGILLDWILFGNKPGPAQLITTAMIMVGTVMAGGLLHAGAHNLRLTGVLYALGAALLYAVYVVANTRIGDKMPLLERSAVMMTGSALGIFIVNVQSIYGSIHVDIDLVKWAVFLAVFGTILPPVLFARGIPKTGAGLGAIIMTAELPVAVICAHVILKEPVDLLQWAGITVMLLSMVLLNRKRKEGV